MEWTVQPFIFISYARRDGEAFARDLRARLVAEFGDKAIWRDREAMEGGIGWRFQIEEALQKVKFLVLVATPGSLVSETTRWEWRYARQQGVHVYPVQVPGYPVDFEQLPHWMRKVHFYDLGLTTQWETFLNHLKSPGMITRIPFMAPDLPDGFVKRAQEFDAIKKSLLEKNHENPIAITTALRGAGGFGKTTLATALCHDEDVLLAFDDGILWVTLGENPSVMRLLNDLYVALTGDTPAYATEDGLANALAERLEEKNCLLVIDDVWKTTHLRPFLRGGRHCARLITTRNFEITVSANAQPITVDEMTAGEAVQMLMRGLGVTGPVLTLPFHKLAVRLGKWPLLLELAHAALRMYLTLGYSLEGALNFLNESLDNKGVIAFDRESSEDRHAAVSSTVEISLELLTPEQRDLFQYLSIFPKDVDIPLSVIQKAWNISNFDAQVLVQRLAALSLVMFDPKTGIIRIHDVMLAYLQQKNQSFLADWNCQFLDACGIKTWHTMSEKETYLWNNLAYHLVQAERCSELLELSQDLRFLARKVYLGQAMAIESHFNTVQECPNDPQLSLLQRLFIHSGHIFNRCESVRDILHAIYIRIQHLPELESMVRATEAILPRPCVVASHPLPEFTDPALVRTLPLYRLGVRKCVWSSDNRYIASASYDTDIRIWDTHTHTEAVLQGHRSAVYDCAWSPNDQWLVSASADRTLLIWNLQTRCQTEYPLAGHQGIVRSCCWSPDGKWIGSASADNTLKIWDAETQKEVITLSDHMDEVTDCEFSPDGQWLASTSFDNTVIVWSVATWTKYQVLIGHDDKVRSCKWKPDSQQLASTSSDHTVRIWDIHTGQESCILKGHSDSVRDCAWHPNGQWLASASSDATLKVWDINTRTEQRVLYGHTLGVRGCDWSADGRLIVSAAYDGTLKVWDALLATTETLSKTEMDWVLDCRWSPDGSFFATASRDGTVTIHNAETREIQSVLSGHAHAVFRCAWSPDGQYLVSAAFDDTLAIWDLATGAIVHRLKNHVRWVRDCAWSPKGDKLVSASDDHTLIIWDTKTGKEDKFLWQHDHYVRTCSWSLDGEVIVSGSADNSLKIWDVHTSTCLKTLHGHTDKVLSCAISPDGAWLVSASADHTLRVWDMQSDAVDVLEGHKTTVLYCRISPNGKWIASVSHDNTMRIWNAQARQCIAVFHADGALFACDFHPQDDRIIAVGQRGIYYLQMLW